MSGTWSRKAITTNAVGAVYGSLTLMLYLLVPWTATNLIDFFFVRRGHYAITDLFRIDGIYGVWAWRGLVAYAVGFAVEIPFMYIYNLFTFKTYYEGPFAKDLNNVDIAWIVGLIATSDHVRDRDPELQPGVRDSRHRGERARAGGRLAQVTV